MSVSMCFNILVLYKPDCYYFFLFTTNYCECDLLQR